MFCNDFHKIEGEEGEKGGVKKKKMHHVLLLWNNLPETFSALYMSSWLPGGYCIEVPVWITWQYNVCTKFNASTPNGSSSKYFEYELGFLVNVGRRLTKHRETFHWQNHLQF